MFFHQKPAVATSGENRVTFALPVGAILKQVNAQNSTKPWQDCTIQISEMEDGTGASLSLKHAEVQCGIRDVQWSGEMKIDRPYIFVGAVFSGCDANDALTLTVGYEMPPRQRGIWERWW